jgi:hypothetical protein
MGWDGKKKVSERRPERKGKCGAQDKLEMKEILQGGGGTRAKSLKVSGACVLQYSTAGQFASRY